MEGKPAPPVLVKLVQYLFVLFALTNAWLLVGNASSPGGRTDEGILTGRLILLSIILFVVSAVMIGGQSKYARLVTITSCILVSFIVGRRLYSFHFSEKWWPIMVFGVLEVFEIFLLMIIMLFLFIAGYFAFSPQVIRYFRSERGATSFDS